MVTTIYKSLYRKSIVELIIIIIINKFINFNILNDMNLSFVLLQYFIIFYNYFFIHTAIIHHCYILNNHSLIININIILWQRILILIRIICSLDCIIKSSIFNPIIFIVSTYFAIYPTTKPI